MSENVIANIEASAPRRVIAIAILAGLGALLIYLALSTPAELSWKGFLVLLGGLSLWLAESMRQATQSALKLTENGLFDTNGEELASIDEIASVSRGMMAMKPSSGFTLVLKSKKSPARWRPGLWWRLGSRVGVGGVAAGHQTKPAAQMIEAMLVERARADEA